MVKLGNVAPEGMCEAVRLRLQGEDNWFPPHKIKLQLGKEQLGALYKAVEGEAAGSCHWGSGGDSPGPLLRGAWACAQRPGWPSRGLRGH